MAVTTLHEAALVLKGAHEAIERLLTETAPLQMAYFDERDPEQDADEEAERWQRTGYRAFWEAAYDLIGLLQTIEDADCADTRRRMEDAGFL